MIVISTICRCLDSFQYFVLKSMDFKNTFVKPETKKVAVNKDITDNNNNT